MKNKQLGFTLIELIIVIAIIALLAAATFVAVNPAKRMGNANDAQRWADATAIADAIMLYTADNSGTYPGTPLVDGTVYEINIYNTDCGTISCTDGTATATTSMNVLITGGYIGKIPYDPKTTDSGNCSDYWVKKTATTNKIEVGSCENYGGTITVVR